MKRLFSAFVNGLPGLGLLLLRVIGGVALIVQGLRLAPRFIATADNTARDCGRGRLAPFDGSTDVAGCSNRSD